MALYELIDKILWGQNTSEHAKFNRLGDVYSFRFYVVQIVRTIMVLLNLICLFLSLYINTRTFLFQLHNWAIFFNFYSLFLVWIVSGHQRTEILLNTNAYGKLRRKKTIMSVTEDNEDYVVETIKTHLWKAAIINYEIAQTLSIFSVIMFWAFWREQIIDFQKYSTPLLLNFYRSSHYKIFRKGNKIRSSTIDEIRATDLIKAKDTEFKFMREVVYNYLDKDLNRKKSRLV